MQTALIIAIYTEIFTLGWLGYVISDRRYLRKAVDQARADRNKAWDRISEMHKERIAELHRSADRINAMTARLRETNGNAPTTNTTEEN